MNLIIGYGQIGKAVGEVIGEAHIYDTVKNDTATQEKYDVLHICFPYSSDFIKYVHAYNINYSPEHIIIWSTVPIGTTKQCAGAVHSPIEGRHPNLARSIKDMVRWVGVNNKKEGEFFEDYFKKLYINTHIVDNSNYTEFLKLRSTAKYGINLVWTDYEAQVSKDIGMDFKLLKKFDRDYNKLYHNLSMPQFQRYILDPPGGRIGGHCVVPNAEILDEQFPNEMLKMIKEMQ